MKMRTRLMTVLSGVAIVTSSATAQESCTEMQVYLGISPAHRENVMSYIAPRLNEKFGVGLIAEEIGSAAMVERLSAQGANPRVSIAHWDVPVGIEACDRDLCAPIDTSRVPNISNLFDWAVTEDEEGRPIVLASGVVAVGLIYNEEAIEQAGLEPPTSWEDLKQPELEGRISITHPNSTWGVSSLVMLARLKGGGEHDIDPGYAEVEEIMPNVHTVHTWSSELSNLLQLGEVWLGTTGSILAPPLRDQGLPVKWIVPAEGSPLVNSGVSLIRNSPCQEVAHEYLNLYLSDEFQVMRAVEGGISSARKDVWDQMPEDARANASITPEDYEKLVSLDWEAISQVRPQWIQRWQREVR